jgi:hypothetical protein
MKLQRGLFLFGFSKDFGDFSFSSFFTPIRSQYVLNTFYYIHITPTIHFSLQKIHKASKTDLPSPRQHQSKSSPRVRSTANEMQTRFNGAGKKSGKQQMGKPEKEGKRRTQTSTPTQPPPTHASPYTQTSLLPPQFLLIILILFLRPFIYTLPLLPFPQPQPTDVLTYDTSPSKLAARLVRWDAVHYLRKSQGLTSPSSCSIPPTSSSSSKATYIQNEPLPPAMALQLNQMQTSFTETPVPKTFVSTVHPTCPEIEYNEVRA